MRFVWETRGKSFLKKTHEVIDTLDNSAVDGSTVPHVTGKTRYIIIPPSTGKKSFPHPAWISKLNSIIPKWRRPHENVYVVLAATQHKQNDNVISMGANKNS